MAQSAFYIMKPYLGFAILLCVTTISLGYPSGESVMNVKIGLDLTREKNGMPSIKVRQFESGEYNPRAESSAADSSKEKENDKEIHDETKPTTPAKSIRAGTSSSSEEVRKDKEELSFETSKQKTEEASAEEYLPKGRVTRGGGYEPEGDDGAKNFNSDSDGRRRKRSANKVKKNLKKKAMKRYSSGRKQE